MAEPADETHVVTCFLRAGGDVLLLHRSSEVGSYPGCWGAVAGHAEGNPDESARREIREETGIEDVTLVRKGDPFPVRDEQLGKTWIVHPYLFDAERRDPRLNWESDRYEWVSPTVIPERNAVPELWTSYCRVAPSLEDVRSDKTHGSAYISLRALEVLRDGAASMRQERGEGGPAPPALRELAVQLIESRPSMAAVRNRINRAMQRALSGPPTERLAHEVLREAVEQDRRASARAAELAERKTVLTLSRSGTVTSALAQARARVLITRSHPGEEGIGVAEQLAGDGCDVTLLSDASMATAPDFDLVLVGADTILPDGTLVNKVGTYLAALAARERSAPVYVAASLDKILTVGEPGNEEAPASALYEGEAPLRLVLAMFERTPPSLISGYITERGLLSPDDISAVSETLRSLEAWRER